jgi:hypothetical protein
MSDLWRLLPGFLLCLMAGASFAYESDNYNNRMLPVADAMPLLDAHVNEAIRQIVSEWHGRRNDMKFAKKVYWQLGGLHWVDHIERWAMKNPDIERYPQTRYNNIYKGMPIWATRVNFLFGVGKTLKVNGVIIGSDKLGHFFSQGMKYYRREVRGWKDERIYHWGAFVERWLFGQFTTGVYSNADLVANYEGLLFYRSLFEPDIVPGKPPIIVWEGDKPVFNRPFTWKDHVNDYWDEVLDPSWVIPSVYKRLRPRIREFCDEYRQAPRRYTTSNDTALWARYEKIGLKDMRENQMQNICADGSATEVASQHPKRHSDSVAAPVVPASDSN